MTTTLKRLKGSLLALFTRSWPLTILMIFCGIVLMIVGQLWHTEDDYLKVLPMLLEHLGVALAVAAFVGMLFHLHEFSEFFTSLAAATLTEDDYLHKLNKNALLKLRANAVKAMMASSEVIDNPGYDSDHLVKSLDDLLFKKLLPGETELAGVYRQDLMTTITLEYMTLGDALKDVSAHTANVPKEALQTPVIKQTTTSTYKIVVPRLEEFQKGYTHRACMSCICADIPYFPVERRGRYRIGHSEELCEEKVMTHEQSHGRITLRADAAIVLNPDESNVWCEFVEYRALGREPFILNVMNMLTRNIDVSVDYIGSQALTFFGDAFGLDDKVQVNYIRMGRGVRIRIPGWLLENHGYFIWWWEQRGAIAPPAEKAMTTEQEVGRGTS